MANFVKGILNPRALGSSESSMTEFKSMPTGDKYPFTKKNVDNVPEQAGVYALYDGDVLIYYGRAQGGSVTLRTRLQDHQTGREGKCTQSATHYRREITASAVAREKELLLDYERRNGRLPRCNSRVG